MQALPVAEKVERCCRSAAGRADAGRTATLVTRVVTEAGPRLVVAGDILDYDYFFVPDDRLAYDEKALDKHLRKPPGPTLLPKLRAIVAAAEPFDAATLKARGGGVRRGRGRQAGAGEPDAAGGDDGQRSRVRDLRDAGDSRPGAVPGADRPGDA